MAIRWKLNYAGLNEVKQQWAAGEGSERAARVLGEMIRTAPSGSGDLRLSIDEVLETHPQGQPVFHIGSYADYALVIESRTGFMSRALDAGMGGS